VAGNDWPPQYAEAFEATVIDGCLRLIPWRGQQRRSFSCKFRGHQGRPGGKRHCRRKSTARDFRYRANPRHADGPTDGAVVQKLPSVTPHYLPTCCRYRTTDGIQRRTDAGAAPTANLSGAQFAITGADKLKTGANDCRGCALGRSNEPGSFRPSGGPDREP
jgi:hypothetical protein